MGTRDMAWLWGSSWLLWCPHRTVLRYSGRLYGTPRLQEAVTELNIKSVINVTRTLGCTCTQLPRSAQISEDSAVPAQSKHVWRVRVEGWAQLGSGLCPGTPWELGFILEPLGAGLCSGTPGNWAQFWPLQCTRTPRWHQGRFLLQLLHHACHVFLHRYNQTSDPLEDSHLVWELRSQGKSKKKPLEKCTYV